MGSTDHQILLTKPPRVSNETQIRTGKGKAHNGEETLDKYIY